MINTSILGSSLALVSKYTHLDRLCGAFTSPEEIEIDEKHQRDSWRYRGRSLNQVAWDGEEDLGFALEKEREVDFLVKWKREKNCKGRIYIGFDFCKGVAIKELERGFMQIGVMGCLPWPMVAGHGDEELMRALMRKWVGF